MIDNKFYFLKKTLRFLLIFCLVFALKGTINIETKEIEKEYNYQREQIPSVPNRILVKYKRQSNSWLQAEVKSSLEATYGIKEIKYFSFIDVYLYETYWYKENTLEWLNKNPYIEFSEPDYIVYIDSATPNDPSFSNLWGLHNTGQTGGTADADIDAPEAWDLSTGSSSVVVAVIDTGVDYNQEDLSANMWTNSGETPGNSVDDDGNGYVDDYYGINAIEGSDYGDPWDDHGHGTHTSGTVAGVGNNGVGVVGVCWTAKIMALKFLNSDGWGNTADAVECVEYAINKGAHIMSNSWGGGGYSSTLKAAIEAAKDAGILFMAAAGNSWVNTDTYPHYPSSYDCENIISVTATDSSDNQWYNYGPTSVDVAAPGVSILSTLPGNNYASWSGTSMATPHVAGLAALIKSYDSSLTWQQIKDRIFNGVETKSSLSGKIATEGRINAYNSLLGSSPVTPVISGTVTTAGDGGLEGVTITFSNGGGTAATGSSGNYSQTVSSGWSGSATPSKSSYTFSPSSRSYSNVTSSQPGQDYTGIPDVTTCIDSVPSDRWKGEYYDNMDLNGSVSMVRDDGDNSLNFDWGTASPSTSCGLGSDGFSVRWTRTVSFDAGTWRFTVTSDDGFRLYVDGSLVLEYWIDQPSTTYTVDVSLTSGDHTIVLEYYENGGGAVAKLSWENVSGTCTEDVPSGRWKGEYYNNMDLSGSPSMTRDDGDSTLDFDWGTGSPSTSCGIGSDGFSVRWTRTVSFDSGTWRFTVTSDDGFRLYVDGSLVLDYWIDQVPTTYTVDVSLTSGDHTIILEYYENGGGAVAKLSWAAVSGSCFESVPSDRWKGEYYNNMDLSGSADMERDDGDGELNFDWGEGSPSATCGIGVNGFSVRWTRTISFESGTWRFTVRADDGFRLYMDDSLVLDYWIDQPPTTYTADVDLASGDHTIKLEYYDNVVGAVAKLSWEKN